MSIYPIVDDNIIVADDSTKANILNELFLRNFVYDDGNVVRSCAKCSNVIEDIALNVVDIYGLLEKHSTTGSFGPDELPQTVCKRLSAVLVKPLSLINKKRY